ncbi:uncharacterized protein I303_103775 [Kwoniella dejecticola CBS 10117]|uniref:Tubulin-folding cofactor B n=1 Tax=Kwoniella dejecticola CBS 10117 TaxID=1296121 RepID=A0A1A6A7P1_9TREE|nr:tubulin-folding cofactor B [Kwoniella dejecticola CBS 10117]OBR86075.1 tubulin-folding cofactor B [Kwoniella dejecticola CBS 10117]
MPLISIFVTSPDTHSERRFDDSLTISQLKDKLVPITGISPQYQNLSLYASSDAAVTGKAVLLLNEENKTLSQYGVKEWQCIKIDNSDPNYRPGEFTDETNLERFELTNEEYESRNDTVLSHLKANKLGRFAPIPTNLTCPPPPSSTCDPSIIPGARCRVSRGDSGEGRLGTVRFVGEAPIGKGGVWVGVELDEPQGKGDGEVEGKRYFQCSPRHATFVRPEKVAVGDYPEEDLMASDEDEI